jgi:N-acetylneuraminate synthase
MIRLAAAAGADAVKFQAYRADTLAHPNSPTYFQQTGQTAKTQHKFFKRYDSFGPREYEQLAAECRDVGVDFLCTPFDLQAVQWLAPLVPAWKIASADLTNAPLMDAVVETKKPVLLSTGASTLREIERAYYHHLAGCAVALLHCVLAYPTPPEAANLLSIPILAQRFPNALIGYSDHTLASPAMETCTFAYLLGARVIEKHFTDNKTEPGNDHYHSMDAADLYRLKRNIDEARVYLGAAEKTVLSVEKPARQYARRGLYAARDLEPKTVLRLDDIAILRPSAEIGPEDVDTILGKILTRELRKGEPLNWEALGVV